MLDLKVVLLPTARGFLASNPVYLSVSDHAHQSCHVIDPHATIHLLLRVSTDPTVLPVSSEELRSVNTLNNYVTFL